MKRLVVLCTVLGFFCTMVSQTPLLQAQELDDLISKYAGVNGPGYMQPLADAFGANLNTGLINSAGISKDQFNIRFSLELMLAPISDDAKTFMAQTEEPFFPDTTVSAPTVFGSTEGSTVTGTGGTEYLFPGGLNVAKFPFLIPQLSIGSIYGTQVIIRYIDIKIDDSIGRVKTFGFGIRHSISQWIKKDYPFDVAAAFSRQSFDIGDLVEANATYFGLIGSYDHGIVSLYGGPGFESSSMDIAYTIEDNADTTNISYDLDGSNKARFTIGAAVDLKVLRLHIDYSLASQSTIGFGIGFGM